MPKPHAQPFVKVPVYVLTCPLECRFNSSAQDRFLVMAAEMEQTSGTGPAELTQF